MVAGDNLAHDHQQEYCPYYLFGFFTTTFFNIDVVFMQMDRALAVYWNLNYRSRVTSKLAIKSCMASKFIAAILTFLVAGLDRGYNNCSEPFAIFFLKRTNIYFDSFPSMAVSSILVANSIYTAVTIVKLDTKLNPVVNLPTLPTLSAEVEQSNGQIQQNEYEPESCEQIHPASSSKNDKTKIFQDKYAKENNNYTIQNIKAKYSMSESS